MSNEQERMLRSWLLARDPGDAPARLRAAVAAVPGTTSPTFRSGFGVAMTRVLGLSRTAWIGVVVVLVLVVALAVAGAALWRALQPFPPHGLIAFTVPLSSTGGTGIHLVSVDGTNARAVSPGAANTYDHSPRWSADGRTLLFARTSALDAFSACGGVGSIVLYDARTATERVLATGLRPINVVDWTPAGDQVAYLWPPPGCGAPGELGLVDVASGKVTTSPLGEGTWRLQRTTTGISAVKAAIESPGLPGGPPVTTWEVDSTSGAFVASLTAPSRDAVIHLDLIERETGARFDLGAGGAPSWSPDGRSLAFIQVTSQFGDYGIDYRDRLVVVSGAGWKARILGDVLVPDAGARLFPLFWTDDGRAIYWMDTKGGHVVEVATGNVVNLPAAVNGCEDIQWQPTPR